LGLPAALVLLVVSYLFKHDPLLRYFLRTRTAMARKKITGDELNAHAKANGYQMGFAYRDKDSHRGRNKHVDKVKQDQEAALDRSVV
jgi:hypothetical protein